MSTSRSFAAVVALATIATIGPTAWADVQVLIDEATANARCVDGYPGTSGPDPLSPCQWDMAIIAGDRCERARPGSGAVVGVIDGGVDFTHPDLAGAIDVVEVVLLHLDSDTPTADPAGGRQRRLLEQGAVQDLQGHGTHVATTIAGRVNGVGIVGVAPEATIVGLKACTIVGYCFADSVAAALRYAGDQRLDVVNLSLFADPYLYYCANEAGQRAILQDLQEAARYAQQRGRGDRRLGRERGRRPRPSRRPTTISPDWPPDTARRPRGSQQLPRRAGRTAGRRHRVGDRRHHARQLLERRQAGVESPRRAATRLRRRPPCSGVGASSRAGRAPMSTGHLGGARRPRIARSSSGGGRYVWISGTSMASPHAAGVAALIRGLDPAMPQGAVASRIGATATSLECPAELAWFGSAAMRRAGQATRRSTAPAW